MKSMPSEKNRSKSSGKRALLSIGELSERTGVTTSALRYYDDLGLVRPEARASGHRRYAVSAVIDVGTILFLQEVGFTLAEIGWLVAGGQRRPWREIVDHKLAELSEQERRLRVARVALEHAKRCPADAPVGCPRFRSIIEGQLEGLSWEESHARLHAT